MNGTFGGDHNRTALAAERTWLAWWRTGIATAAAGVGVGGVVPQFVKGDRTAFILIGAGYALLALAIFALGGRRQAVIGRLLDEQEDASLAPGWVVGFTVVGCLLSLGTLVTILTHA